MSFTFLKSRQFNQALNIISLVALVAAAYFKISETTISSFSLQFAGTYYILLLLLLSPVTWGIEAQRLRSALKIDMATAWKSTLNGLLFRFMLASPGEVLGRQRYLPSEIKAKANVASWTTLKFSAGIVSAAFGICSLLIIGINKYPFIANNWWLLAIAGILISAGIIIFIIRLDKSIFSLPIFLKISFMHTVRFILILFQFVLAFKALGLSHSTFDIITGMSLVLFMRSIIPVFHWIGEVGVREISALYIFDATATEVILITTAVFIVWFSNNVLTSLCFWIYKNREVVWR
ncbi:hypothetical protein OO013_07460 [Mangrovivirga sp. M17]|uniref:Lysylphosphatidylglycerol synthase-like protein n=1 Tax=Mangrovivirga halotolerans TaxID=2993936 RepID=A0ABT3RPH9_9BACT|nr:hypothetical protein [Mangrovivirga halotolerans]MCX2743696.1 hypothetical protein [Mangrovivirga halotolerans]